MTMTMRKKDYEAIARVIRSTAYNLDPDILSEQQFGNGINTACAEIAGKAADYCAAQDPTFKRDRFLADCGVSHD